MTITKKTEGKTLTVSVAGRLDTMTAPQMEMEITAAVEGMTDLILDFSELQYLSSAGLRSLLALQKIMKRQGTMMIENVNEIVMEVFDVTGFSDILTIKQ